MKIQQVLVFVIVLVVIAASIFGYLQSVSYDSTGYGLEIGYSVKSNSQYSDNVPIPAGDLNAYDIILLPDLYEEGKGFTCTGLAFDESTNTFLVGEIGALLPGEQITGSIVRVTRDFSRVLERIPVSSTDTKGVQGVALDTSDNTIWFCYPNGNKIWHISISGKNMGSITTSRPTGIAYDERDDTFWVLSFDGNIRHITKSGTVLKTIAFSFNEPLDQCFLDKHRGLLYITAGTNYSGRNNVYCLNISTEEQYIACTVDSYAVEGIWLGNNDKMIILNDGYFHGAIVEKNQANVYAIG